MQNTLKLVEWSFYRYKITFISTKHLKKLALFKISVRVNTNLFITNGLASITIFTEPFISELSLLLVEFKIQLTYTVKRVIKCQKHIKI